MKNWKVLLACAILVSAGFFTGLFYSGVLHIVTTENYDGDGEIHKTGSMLYTYGFDINLGDFPANSSFSHTYKLTGLPDTKEKPITFYLLTRDMAAMDKNPHLGDVSFSVTDLEHGNIITEGRFDMNNPPLRSESHRFVIFYLCKGDDLCSGFNYDQYRDSGLLLHIKYNGNAAHSNARFEIHAVSGGGK